MERQLQLSIATLKLRRGLLLPKNAGAETIAVDEAQWTYAIFLAVLLRNLHYVQRDRSVSLHFENGERVSRWNPLSGSLYENNFYYSVIFSPQAHIENTDIFMAAISGRIVPAMAFRWLASNAVLNECWWNAILQKSLISCDIEKLIVSAADKLGFSLVYEDPYAEWYLLKSYQALFDTREKLKVIETQLTSMLNSIRGIEIDSCISTKPVNYPLQFATPFGYMGAYLVADVDYVLRQRLMLERIGIPMPNENMAIKKMVSYVQDVFAIPRKWRHTRVTRKDIEKNNENAQRAKEQLGEVPEIVLKQKVSFAFLPKKENSHGK